MRAAWYDRTGPATVIATASTRGKQRAAADAGADHVIDYRQPNAAQAILDRAPGGVDRVIDVAFGVNLPLSSAVIAPNGIIAAYGSDAAPAPQFPFYPLARKGVTIRTVLVFITPPDPLRTALWIQHDLGQYQTLRLAPEYCE